MKPLLEPVVRLTGIWFILQFLLRNIKGLILYLFYSQQYQESTWDLFIYKIADFGILISGILIIIFPVIVLYFVPEESEFDGPKLHITPFTLLQLVIIFLFAYYVDQFFQFHFLAGASLAEKFMSYTYPESSERIISGILSLLPPVLLLLVKRHYPIKKKVRYE